MSVRFSRFQRTRSSALTKTRPSDASLQQAPQLRQSSSVSSSLFVVSLIVAGWLRAHRSASVRDRQARRGEHCSADQLRGGQGTKELVLRMYSAYPGRRSFRLASSRGTPDTRSSKNVMSKGLNTVNSMSAAAAQTRNNPHQRSASPK